MNEWLEKFKEWEVGYPGWHAKYEAEKAQFS